MHPPTYLPTHQHTHAPTHLPTYLLTHPLTYLLIHPPTHLLNLLISSLSLTHPQLFEGLKCESKWKTAEKRRVGTRSLAHNTWGVEGHVGTSGRD
jgi:hypothetical protein